MFWEDSVLNERNESQKLFEMESGIRRDALKKDEICDHGKFNLYTSQ